MIQRLFWAAIIAGLVGGAGVSVFHLQTAVPLIIEAEEFEQTQSHGHDAGLTGLSSPTDQSAAESAVALRPDDGFERMGFTVLANIVIGLGFSMLLFSCFALCGRPVNASQGLLWGLAGFATFWLAPAAGLPPELPGAAAADLFDRQVWWLGTAAATGGGLALVAFAPRAIPKLAGLVIICIPHLVGAPHPDAHMSTVPAELAARFVVVSLLSAAVLWSLLGGVGGWLYHRWNLQGRAV